jgi:hypothetical protein
MSRDSVSLPPFPQEYRASGLLLRVMVIPITHTLLATM